MSAAEIIEQIKALPKDDFQVVAKFIDELREGEGTTAKLPEQVRPGFRETAGEVFRQYDDLFRELAK